MTCLKTEVACQKNRRFLKEAEPTRVCGSRGTNSCPMAQVLNIEEVLEALNVAGPADPANAVMAIPIMLHGHEGEGEEEVATEAVAGAVEVGAVGLVLVTHRVVEEDGGWPRRWRRRRTEQQAAACNRSGRARTSDHRFLAAGSLDGRRPTGRGAWKCWTPEAVLRSGFSDEKREPIARQLFK